MWLESERADLSSHTEHIHRYLRVLGEPTRLSIVLFLAQTPATPNQLAIASELTRATISYHLRRLKAAGIVTFYESEYRRNYQLSPAGLVIVQTLAEIASA